MHCTALHGLHCSVSQCNVLYYIVVLFSACTCPTRQSSRWVIALDFTEMARDCESGQHGARVPQCIPTMDTPHTLHSHPFVHTPPLNPTNSHPSEFTPLRTHPTIHSLPSPITHTLLLSDQPACLYGDGGVDQHAALPWLHEQRPHWARLLADTHAAPPLPDDGCAVRQNTHCKASPLVYREMGYMGYMNNESIGLVSSLMPTPRFHFLMTGARGEPTLEIAFKSEFRQIRLNPLGSD